MTLSHLFKNREEAALVLAQRLAEYKGTNTVVLAISRNALPIAKTLAAVLNADLDVFLVKRLGAPNNPDIVIGALTELGDLCLTDIGQGLSARYIDSRTRLETAILHQQRAQLQQLRPSISLSKRDVIIVDDGIATGASMSAALQSIHHFKPNRIAVAAIAASPEVSQTLAKFCNDFVAIHKPLLFENIENYFSEFPPVTVKTAERILAEEQHKGFAASGAS